MRGEGYRREGVMAHASIPCDELLWRQYQLQIDLYKHYMDLTLKFNAFYYAITGGIVSFYFSRSDVSILKYSLTFPIVMSLGYAAIGFYIIPLIENFRRETIKIRDDLGMVSSTEFRVLSIIIGSSATLFVIIAAGLLALLLSPSGILPRQ